MTEKVLMTKYGSPDKPLRIENLEIPCYVLEDGTRVVSERSVTKALGGKRGGSHWKRIRENPDGAYFPVYLSANNLKPYINNDLALALNKPIKYQTRKGGLVAFGLEAQLLPDICDVWLKARDAGPGVLKPGQKHIAEMADILMRGFAKVGIIALIDEATGYQEVRDRLALQQILDKYLREEYAKWAKIFPDEFYEKLFKMKGWQYRPLTIKKPGVVGHWTNDLIYQRLAPGILDELRIKNPKGETGRRKQRHHQWLTEDYGSPALKQHLSNVMFLLDATPNWTQFYRALQRAAPKYGHTIPLEFNEKEDEIDK